MHTQSYANTPGYLILIFGLILAFTSALVPFFEAGYILMTSVLIAGLLPYLVYGMVVPLLRSTKITVIGLVIVFTHALLVLSERFIGNADYSDSMIYYGPTLLAVAVLPLVLMVIKKSRKF